MLEAAESEFTELLAESTAAENAAGEAFEKLSRKSKLSRTAKVEEGKGKESAHFFLGWGLERDLSG